MTSHQLRIPDPETAKKTIANLRQACLGLQEVDQKLEELNELFQRDLERQWSKSWSKRRQSVGLE